MACRIRGLLVLGAGLVLVTGTVSAQEMPNPQEMQLQVQRIVQDRPQEAEAAARAFLHLIAMRGASGRVEDRIAELDSLKATTSDAYWREVAQLTVQFDVVQKLVRRDSVRAGIVAQLFGTEVQARSLQRAYRTAAEARRQAIRARITELISQHFYLEDSLRVLEIADIERRLAEVRAETQRRRQKRAELVQWAVDDIIRDATRPQ